ncbi:hypothetical protein ACEPAI_2624 [Sanghuangporus weigelae]
MASAPSHKSSMSNLEPPPDVRDKSERKRSYRVPPPPAPIDIPEPVDVRRPQRRPPSPLRNSYTPDDASEDGSDDENEQWGRDPSSPSPSITKIASEFAHRVGALVGSAGSRNSQHLPTQAELEAEAERERERSRREAEMIMRREAEERKMVEDGVFAMMDGSSQKQPLQPPPPRSQTMSSNRSSPSSSPKEKENWFMAVKNKLTPTKEPLTPAQQIIQEAKAKEKEKEKKKGKEKEKDPKEWPSTPSRKFSDPAFLNLAATTSPEPVTPPRPVAQNGTMTPSPGRSIDSTRDGPPLYAQFNNQRILVVPETLLTIARRFEKLERWTVSHVRALEERMGDVERWLVEKEKEKEEETAAAQDDDEEAAARSENNEKSGFHSDEDEDSGKEDELFEIREELVELQGRVGELGREMAKLMTAPLNLASGPARNAAVGHSKYVSQAASTPNSPPAPTPALAPAVASAPILSQPLAIAPTPAPTATAVPPTPTSIGPRSLPALPVNARGQPTATPVRPKEPTSPPTAQRSSSVLSSGSGRTRLPYPTGDYTSPPGSIPTKQDVLSPTNSPPSSLTEATRKRPLSIAGLPSDSSSIFQASQSSTPSTSGLPSRQEPSSVRALSPNPKPSTGTSPISSGQRQPSISPTPRKRYTVALGQPISSANTADRDEYDWRERATFSASPVAKADVFGDDEDEHRNSYSDASEDDYSEARAIQHSRDGTIGKSESHLANPPTIPNDTLRRGNSTTTPPRESPGSRVRAQSSYGPPKGFHMSMLSATSSANASPSPIAPLRPRVRSKSIDPIGLGISVPNGNGRFVDPLVLRKELEPKTPRTPKFERGRKVPVGELVAFFDQERQ